MPRSSRFTPRVIGIAAAISIVATAVMLSWKNVSAAPAKTGGALSDFMRKKLDISSKVLEGLATEDAALIKEGASGLLEMSKAEMWNVIVDEDYREFNREFRGAVRKLNQAAENGNFDNAALQWFDAVKGCVECHKYVRGQRSAKQ